MKTIEKLWAETKAGLIFANLVDFDMLYGHRRDVAGYSKALRDFDEWLGQFVENVGAEDLVILTADHGNDPPAAERITRASKFRCLCYTIVELAISVHAPSLPMSPVYWLNSFNYRNPDLSAAPS
jgi:hypothetical protein